MQLDAVSPAQPVPLAQEKANQGGEGIMNHKVINTQLDQLAEQFRVHPVGRLKYGEARACVAETRARIEAWRRGEDQPRNRDGSVESYSEQGYTEALQILDSLSHQMYWLMRYRPDELLMKTKRLRQPVELSDVRELIQKLVDEEFVRCQHMSERPSQADQRLWQLLFRLPWLEPRKEYGDN